ncbi:MULTISPECIES: HNH endonuclease signature motif containing protein [unclassified Microbacterium]|uniref:HNH endonuclease signature motif containing protein n=1 Tax=unclassified Microbacterium TaxID=2609290 RepID=UPI000CFBF74B|nr:MULTISPECIES: HNH endonuclease signature motif containing protein [unclassified Microbacterium]PQZ60048.1 HNH endonuclease [Microbacterium sp. MYb43]PQZ79604.1 HNH endonuclease [Microbacterium sp. MYb40]PRB23091.1 HNH endonuclease [Microbacterium sp. MYb54]PRB27630.1 HNH endonuclease [Microbacterium sp. MYb50]PRB65920.1 HNH endonuclease [Microbacterium sp. MYb24]
MTALADATLEQVGALGALVEMLVGVERSISSLQAARDGILAVGSRLALEVAEQAEHPDHGEMSARTVAAEFAAALRVSDRTVQRRMADAAWVVERFPLVWEAQGAGRISAAHARVVCEAGEHLEDAVSRDAYATQMIAFAETESPARVGRMARRVAERFQARSIHERHLDAREKRSVWVKDVGDGMTQLGLLGPSALVHGAFERLTQIAKAVQEPEFLPGGQSVQEQSGAGTVPDAGPAAAADADASDQRTIAQLRADLALDLLLTGAPAGHDTSEGLLAAIRGSVSITVPVTTLMGDDATPAELNGRTPIDPATARRFAGAASGWDRILTHPITGALLAVDRYRPGSDLKRHLSARDQRCRFPTCGYASIDCDVDHHHDAALGGATSESNLGHLCRRHHMLKHHSPWAVESLGGGVYAWTSPTGKIYIDRPPPQNTVTFTEDHAAPPF